MLPKTVRYRIQSSKEIISDLCKALHYSNQIRNIRNREQNRFNDSFSHYSTLNQNDLGNSTHYAKFASIRTLFRRSRYILSLKRLDLSSFINIRYKLKTAKSSQLLVVFQPSRIKRSSTKASLQEIIVDLLHNNIGSIPVKESIISKLQMPLYGLASGLDSERESLRYITGNLIGSGLDIMAILLLNLNPAYLIVAILKKCISCPNLSITEAVLFSAILPFIKKSQTSDSLFLTSNSRIADIYLVSVAVCQISCTELLHGQPDKYIYARHALLAHASMGKYKAYRQTPVTHLCQLSKSYSEDFLNFKIPSSASHYRHYNIKREVNNRVIFIGGTSHHSSYSDSGIYSFEVFIIQHIRPLLQDHNLRLVYATHPAEREASRRESLHSQVEKIDKLSFSDDELPFRTITILSSAAWEYSYLGIKSMICLPEGYQPYSTSDLSYVNYVSVTDPATLQKAFGEFIQE